MKVILVGGGLTLGFAMLRVGYTILLDRLFPNANATKGLECITFHSQGLHEKFLKYLAE